MNRAIFLVLLFSAAHAAAQPAPPQQTPPPERKAPSGETRLNLKLDQPARMYVQETPGSEKSADNLPSLGSGAILPEREREPARAERRSPYPQDTETGR
jgi:hypothetical protein